MQREDKRYWCIPDSKAISNMTTVDMIKRILLQKGIALWDDPYTSEQGTWINLTTRDGKKQQMCINGGHIILFRPEHFKGYLAEHHNDSATRKFKTAQELKQAMDEILVERYYK
jgi:hypothetical protein